MLVDEDGTVLLGDFGVGVFVGEREKSTNALSNEGKRKSFVGTVSGNTYKLGLMDVPDADLQNSRAGWHRK